MAEGESSPWSRFRAQSWDAEVGGLKIKFRDSGSAAALIEVLFGSQFEITQQQREAAVAELVTSSIVDPILTKEEFHSLGMGAKFQLLLQIMQKIGVNQDFSVASALGAAPTAQPESTPEIPAGGSGAQPRLSVTVRPRKSKPPSESPEPSKPSTTA